MINYNVTIKSPVETHLPLPESSGKVIRIHNSRNLFGNDPEPRTIKIILIAKMVENILQTSMDKRQRHQSLSLFSSFVYLISILFRSPSPISSFASILSILFHWDNLPVSSTRAAISGLSMILLVTSSIASRSRSSFDLDVLSAILLQVDWSLCR
ncbi:hypothetical protein BJ875DRAFT_463532 [Amylocarpus encephaloides]|uniref:Uncharacterized protein n=1 Tax=Amylocarpus encephaloides TaxID=45428 RepID=A0A9P8C4X6_9HELO|nr:hypothetical protein BJ875DRAFT_463532 [Amylocarpus encephaloides]